MAGTALVERRLEPEWLDELPAADARASRSRCDLRRVNRLMGHRGILCRGLRGLMGSDVPARIVELGAGDGTLLLSAARELAAIWPQTDVTLVDRQDLVSEETRDGFTRLGWKLECINADLPAWLRTGSAPHADVTIANLVLHHFDAGPLRELLHLIANHSRRFIAIEPRRALAALTGSRMLGLIGCNDVTRHDAVVSVQAGFRGAELSRSWPDDPAWRLIEQSAGLFSHLFMARRAGPASARGRG